MHSQSYECKRMHKFLTFKKFPLYKKVWYVLTILEGNLPYMNGWSIRECECECAYCSYYDSDQHEFCWRLSSAQLPTLFLFDSIVAADSTAFPSSCFLCAGVLLLPQSTLAGKKKQSITFRFYSFIHSIHPIHPEV